MLVDIAPSGLADRGLTWDKVTERKGPAMTAVLVVEDEPLVRMLAADILEDEGFEVIEAATAPAALALLEKHEGEIAAVFTDIDMPGGMNGLELAAIVHARWPDMALVITSGVARLSADQLPGDGVFIAKPYASKTPVRIIRELLGEHRAAGPSRH
jgi:CheY-like chemotaxis protein